MKQYKIKLESIKQVLMLQQIVHKYHLKGFVQQCDYKDSLNSAIGMMMTLPLIDLKVNVENVAPESENALDKEMAACF